MLFCKIEALIYFHLWSDSPEILLINGARQVGKTYIINHVADRMFENVIEINMVADSLGNRLFSKGEVDYLVDDYASLSSVPIEVKSGKDYTIHSVSNSFTPNEDYHIQKAFLVSNEREIKVKGRITYLPIYYIMFFSPDSGQNMDLQF